MNSGQWTILGIVLLVIGIVIFTVSAVWTALWMKKFNREYGENS